MSQTKVERIMCMEEGAILSMSVEAPMSGLDAVEVLGEEGPQMRRILPTPQPTNRLAPKEKCRGLEFHQANCGQEVVSHQILLSSVRH